MQKRKLSPKDSKVTTIHFDPKVHEWLKNRAFEESKTMSLLLNELLESIMED